MSNLVMLVSRDFLALTLLAAIPAFVLAWLVIRQWLENFAFRADLNYGLLGLALLLTMLLTLLTTGGQAFRTARLNPAEVLRSE